MTTQYSFIKIKKILFFKSVIKCVNKMAQWTKALATKPGDLSSIPWAHRGKERTNSLQVVV